MIESLVVTRTRPDRPVGGAALRNMHNIHGLAQLGPVDVLSIFTDDAPEPVSDIRQWTAFCHAELSKAQTKFERIRRRLRLLRRDIHPEIDGYRYQEVLQWLTRVNSSHRYDVAVIEELSLAGYLGQLKQTADMVVYDAHNVEQTLRADIGSAHAGEETNREVRSQEERLRWRMTAEERRVIHGADKIWACSDIDQDQINRIYGPEVQVSVVPNAVDVGAYRPADAIPIDGDWSASPITLLYTGVMGYYPNEEAALCLINEVLPILRARGQDARVVIVGRRPSERLQEASRQVSGVELTGEVREILPYFAPACIMVVPLKLASGTRLKILEAFAAGRPVVSTAKAVEGIEAVSEQHLAIRETPEGMADAVLDIWHHEKLRVDLCRNAMELVRHKYSWEAAARCIAGSILPHGSADITD